VRKKPKKPAVGLDIAKRQRAAYINLGCCSSPEGCLYYSPSGEGLCVRNSNIQEE